MSEDTLLQEVRAAREEYARAHGFDVHRIVADLQEMDRAGDWAVVRLAPRKPQHAGLSALESTPSLQPTQSARASELASRK